METFLSVAAAGALKGAIVLAVAGLVNLSWRSSSASARHLVWTIGVASALVLPLAGFAIARLDGPRIPVAVWSPTVTITADVAPGEPAAATTRAADRDFPAPLENPVTNPDVGQRAAETGKASAEVASPATAEIGLSAFAAMVAPSIMSGGWKQTALMVWLLGALVAFLPVALALVRVRLLARGARPVFDGRWNRIIARTPALHHLASRVRILESEATAMPMTWGVVRPTLLVPANAERWPDWQCRNILQHELAHVDRRDCLTQFMAQAACAIYWFNPLVWIAAHRMRVERELACDDRVLAAGSVPSDYAENLLEVARSLRAPSFTSSTAIAMARPSQLSGRLLAVLDTHRNRRSVSRGIFTSAAFAAIASVIALASITPREAVAAPPAPLAIVKAAQLPSMGLVPSAVSVSPQPLPTVFTGISEGEPATPAPSSGWQAQAACWDRTSEGDKSSTSIHSDDSGSRPTWRVRHTSDECTFELRAEGKFTLRPDLTDVESISSGGWLSVEERDGRTTRRVDIRPAGGSLEHVWYVNGERRPYDDSARAWLARVLLDVERRTAFAAETRVPQLYRTGGLNRVLSEVSQMPSAYAKSRYFGTFLEMDVAMDAATLNEVVRRASNDLASSDYYMSEVLGKLARHRSANESTWRTFAEAAGRMKSDYYKSVVLKKVLNSGQLSGETVGTLLRSASGMKSDYYLMDLLKSVAGKYALNDATRAYYAEALSKIESDYYRSELLRAFNKDGKWDSRTSNFVLASVSDIKSDYYRSEALRSLIRTDHVNDWASFFNAVAGIDSDHYKRETLRTALDREPLTREIVAGVLSIAPRIKSDYELSEVLSAVARSYKIDENLRPAFERAVDAIDSDYYRGSALSALRRSMSR